MLVERIQSHHFWLGPQRCRKRHFKHYEIKAIIQCGLKEHEQIIYISSNRRMKQLMDWLSNLLPLLRKRYKSAFLCLGFSVGLTASLLVASYGG